LRHFEQVTRLQRDLRYLQALRPARYAGSLRALIAARNRSGASTCCSLRH